MDVRLTSPTRSPGKIRWSVAGFFFISGFGFATWASRIPSLQHQLRLNEAELGAVLFALPMGLILTLPLTGALIGRFSSRTMMLVGAVLLNVILVVLGQVNQTWQLAVVLFCFGAARNQLSISVNAQSIGVQALYERSILTSFHGIWSIAGFAGAALGSLMISANILPAWHFVIVSVSLTALALVLFPNSIAEPATQSTARSGFVLPDRSLLKFGMMSFTSMAFEGILYDWSGIYFQKVVHAPRALIASGFVVFMIAMTLGRFSGDWLVNRFSKKTVLTFSGLFMTAGLLLAVLLPTVIGAGLGFILVGLGSSCVVPLVMSLASQSKLAGTGSVIAAVSTIAYFGFLIVPPVVGFIAESFNLRWSFGLMSLLGVMMVWLVSRLPNEPD
ncbi:fucose permease [Larkinella arboricola]|uniref:Fucose permease n=1 Tax=Larkinella arboricola TaxID=643671 RepID=A0A327X3C3_LARAB|nr:MFS transporter [Larkinella arboricola]RAK00085.1 fucose permease [Larkinella arboricola]